MWAKTIYQAVIKIIDWGIAESNPDIENRSIRFTNVVLLIILCLQSYSLLTELSIYLRPQELVWDQWSIPLMIIYTIVSLYFNRLGWTLFARILLIITWPLVSYLIPIIIQQTPTDYYVGYPIALIFHGFLIQITLPYKHHQKTTALFLLINFGLILTFPEFLIFFDDDQTALDAMTGNKFYFLNGFTFWLALNLILGYLLRSLNNRIEEIDRQKNFIAIKIEELESTMVILNERQKQLVHSEKMASLVKLSAGLAHQVNNPLNYIMGAKDLIKKQLSQRESAQELEEYFDMMNAGINRIQSIVKNLGLLTNKHEDYKEAFNVYELVQDTILGVRSNQAEHVIIRNNIDPKQTINQNPVLITQILYQLLKNSLDAIEPPSGEINISFEVNKTSGKFLIEDTGRGIQEQNLSKIYDPFYTTKEAGNGTGLGLFIAVSMVNELNGQIQIDSQPSIGTNVTLQFPLYQA